MKNFYAKLLLGLVFLAFGCQQDQEFTHNNAIAEDVDLSRVLFVGNSITRHRPAPDKDWFGDWGMAASTREKDFVHLLRSKFESLPEYDSSILVTAVSFETNFSEFDFSQMDSLRAFEPTLIILNLGENVNDDRARELDYGSSLVQLVDHLKEDRKTTIVCVNSFWDKKTVNAQIRNVSQQESYIFVAIDDLSTPEYQSFNDFESRGIGSHPNDLGMTKIADRIAICLGI